MSHDAMHRCVNSTLQDAVKVRYRGSADVWEWVNRRIRVRWVGAGSAGTEIPEVKRLSYMSLA